MVLDMSQVENKAAASEAVDAPIDEATKKTVQQIPLLKTRAGPRDGEKWVQRLKEEYQALIQVTYIYNDTYT